MTRTLKSTVVTLSNDHFSSSKKILAMETSVAGVTVSYMRLCVCEGVRENVVNRDVVPAPQKRKNEFSFVINLQGI